MKFVVQPFEVSDTAVRFQLFVDSKTRNHGFCGIVSMTKEEFQAFRKLLESGAGKKGTAEVDFHLAFETVE